MKKCILLLILLNLALLLSACNQPVSAVITTADTQPVIEQTVSVPVIEATDRPTGWTAAAHSNTAAPNYTVVFPQDKVNRLDIVITPENWQAMLDDMAALYGEPGTRAGRADGGPRRPGGNAPQDGNVPRDGNAPPNGVPQRPGNPPAAQPQPELPFGRPGGAPGPGMMLESDVNPTYVPVNVVFEGQTWTNVGLRFKGNSSLRSAWEQGNLKMPMRLDFDQFEDEYPEIKNQRFYGFKQLALANGFSDNSLLREKVTADIFRAAGVPAAQTAFYAVYVDHGAGPVYFGLYTLTEIVDDTVIQTQFADDSGNVYKPSGRGATFAAGTFSVESFDKQTNTADADWSDTQALFAALHADTRVSDPAAWRAGMEAVFDVDGFLNWLATNAVVQNWDTYGTMSHNYYLYHDPTTGRLVWIPWDNNMALSSSVGMRTMASLSMDEIGADWPLIRYLLDDAEYHARYVAYVEAASTTAFKPEVMEATYRQLAALIEPYVLAENATHTQLTSTAHFYSAIDELVAHAYARREAVSEFTAAQKAQVIR
jgi:spore coat protein CotH